jgi:hypothetical protein
MHPMYQMPDGDSLRQGDILAVELVRERLRGHLDYFAEKPYFVAYCVLSQTCDLQKDRHVNYVTLAVVREITDAYSRHVPTTTEKTRSDLKSIISHNWNKRAYFYLHPNLDAKLQTASVADLRVSVSLSLAPGAENHYDALLEARRASMTEGYAAALGAMASQVYGRVATTDWDDLNLQPQSSGEYVENLWMEIKDKKMALQNEHTLKPGVETD